MSDWEPVEPDPFIGGTGGNQPLSGASGPGEVLPREQIAELFEQSKEQNLKWTGYYRHRIDSSSLYEVVEATGSNGKEGGPVSCLFSGFDPISRKFFGLGEAYLSKMNRVDYVPSRVVWEDMGGGKSQLDFQWGENGVERLTVRFHTAPLGPLYDQSSISVRYDGSGSIVSIENDVSNNKSDPPLKLDSEQIDAVIGGETLELNLADRMGGRSYKISCHKDRGNSKKFIFLERINQSSVVNAEIPIRVDLNISERLFPKDIFGKDPYSVDPSYHKWFQADWQTMLGGLHWEHSVPQVKDEDTELPEGK